MLINYFQLRLTALLVDLLHRPPYNAEQDRCQHYTACSQAAESTSFFGQRGYATTQAADVVIKPASSPSTLILFYLSSLSHVNPHG